MKYSLFNETERNNKVRDKQAKLETSDILKLRFGDQVYMQISKD